VDNQLVQPQSWAQRIIILVAMLIIAIGISVAGIYWQQISDPYIQEVLSLQGDATKGSAIFQINCAACHGLEANGSVGPSLIDVPRRKSKVGLIYQVTSGKTPPMPKFQPNSQEMADLLSYLEKL
jgi:mono/diheme cytochrome c family protein